VDWRGLVFTGNAGRQLVELPLLLVFCARSHSPLPVESVFISRRGV
jgi:hypothetical protein